MTFSEEIKIIEVGPRDGLQNESLFIPTHLKIEFIERLRQTGLTAIEVTSFVSPKWLPQFSDGETVYSTLPKHSSIHYPVLIPNRQGLERALNVQVKEIAILSAASETFSQKNTRCSIQESFIKNQEILRLAIQNGLKVRSYLSCSLGCPYEGSVAPKTVVQIAKQLINMGCHEISIADTIGVSTPKQAQCLIQMLAEEIPIDQLAVHFHDTFGQGLANIYACLEIGIRRIDSAISGLGGCPYAKGAAGNVATEDVVYMLHGLGLKTGIDLEALINVSEFYTKMIGRPSRSKVSQARLGI